MLQKSGKFALACRSKELVAKFGIAAATNALQGVYQQQCAYVTDTRPKRRRTRTIFNSFMKERLGGQLTGVSDTLRLELFEDLSRAAGQEWTNMSEEEREKFKLLKNASLDEIKELLAQRCKASIKKMLEKKCNKLDSQLSHPVIDVINKKQVRQLAKELERPQFPTNSYALFMSRCGLRASAESGRMWNQLPQMEKAEYIQEAQEINTERRVALAKWQQSLKPGVLELLSEKPKIRYGIAGTSSAPNVYQQELDHTTREASVHLVSVSTQYATDGKQTLKKPSASAYGQFVRDEMGKYYSQKVKGLNRSETWKLAVAMVGNVREKWRTMCPAAKEKLISRNLKEREEWAEMLKQAGPEVVRAELSERWLRKVKTMVWINFQNQKVDERYYNREHTNRIKVMQKVEVQYDAGHSTPLFTTGSGHSLFSRGKKSTINTKKLADGWRELDIETKQEYDRLADKERYWPEESDAEECVDDELEEYISVQALNKILTEEARKLAREMNRPHNIASAMCFYKSTHKVVVWDTEIWNSITESEKTRLKKLFTKKLLQAFENWANSLQPGVFDILNLKDYRKLRPS